MKRTKKTSKKLQIVIIFISVLVLSVLGSINVYATGDIFEITNVDVTEKSDTIEIGEINFDNTTINSNVVCHKLVII